MADEPADLTAFLAAAGRSLADAQGALAGADPEIPTSVAISDAELEVKATVERGPGGAIALQPISSRELLTGRVTAAALSTVRIRYVAVAEDTFAAPSQRPRRSPDDVIQAVKGRDDVVALDKIFGGLEFAAVFVAPAGSWIVTATDAAGRRVREAVVKDAEQ